MVESFIDTNTAVILELKAFHIFGELLDYKYFIWKDFSSLISKMNSIKKNELIKKDSLNKEEITENWNKKLEKEGIIRFGDLHYTKYEFKNIIENSL